jgi:hypothetical protein
MMGVYKIIINGMSKQSWNKARACHLQEKEKEKELNIK